MCVWVCEGGGRVCGCMRGRESVWVCEGGGRVCGCVREEGECVGV